MFNWSKYEGYREVIAYPNELLENRFEMESLWKAAEQAEILYRGWPFIYFNHKPDETRVIGDRIETKVDVSEVRGHEYFEMWTLSRSGLFYHRALMDEETNPKALEIGKILSFGNTIYHISEAIGSLWHLYSGLNLPDQELLTIKFCYKGVKDRNLVVTSPSRAGFMSPQICHVPEITSERSLPLAEWRASEIDLAVEVSAEIFRQFQWIVPNLPSIRQQASELLAKK